MKVVNTLQCKHYINGKETVGRTLVCRDSMEKDGNRYEFIKTYKMDKNCPDVPNGATGIPLFTERGKVGAWESDK